MRTIKRNKILGSCNFDWPPELKPDYAINPYIGCAYNCSYCWARDMTYRFREPWGIPPDFEWDKPLVVENVLELLEVEMGQKKPGRVLLSSMTDPYQPIEEVLGLTHKAIQGILQANWDVAILTKAFILPRRDLPLLELWNRNIWFGITLDISQSLSFSSLFGRLLNIQEACSRGIKTFISLEPWFPGVDIIPIILTAKTYTDYFIIGSLNKAGRAVNPEFYKGELLPLIEWMDKEGIRYYVKKELRRCVEEARDER